MPNPIILLADNDPDFLDICAEFLESFGYKVLKALKLEDARRILEENWVHLTILDIRLVNDEDEKDISGLTLAKESNSSMPKMMLTKFQTWETVRESLGLVVDDQSPAVDFVAKQEGLEELLRRVKLIFARHVYINWNLVIRWNETHPLSFPHLSSSIEPGLQGDRLSDRSSELEDLFRRLFYEENQITISGLLWQCEERVAVTVFTFASDKPSEPFVVICGSAARIRDEFQRYKKFAPAAISSLRDLAETTHFAAYILSGIPLENSQAFLKFYHSNPERRLFQAVIASLQTILATWHRDQRIYPEHEASEPDLYREKLALDKLGQVEFKERVLSLRGEAARHGLKLDLTDETINFQLPGVRVFSYRNPLPYLYGSIVEDAPTALCVIAPGTLTPENILIAPDGWAWLTDFSEAGPAPLLWNYIVLEAAIRFDLVESDDLSQLHEMERRLTEVGKIGRLDTRDVDRPIRAALQFIEMIRLAVAKLTDDPYSYHLGLLFCAAGRAAGFQLGVRRMRGEVIPALHALLAAGMICERVLSASRIGASTDSEGIEMDLINQLVRVDGREVDLTPTEFKLLAYLYKHAGQLCSRQDVFEYVWKNEKYDPKNNNSRLDTNIDRLREKLEPNASVPRYLLVKRGEGYRLFTRPKM